MSRTTWTIAIVITTVACSKPVTLDTRISPDADDVPDYLRKHAGSTVTSRPGVPDDVRPSHLDEWQKFNKAASSFKVSDGISRDEAEFLGEAYFVWQLGGCGFAGPAKASKKEWRMRPRVGLRGQLDSSYIRVDKRTGVVRYDSEDPIAARDLIEIERRRLQRNQREYVWEPAEEPANKPLQQSGSPP